MVTAQQVKDAMIAAEIYRVDCHECSLCGHMVFWQRYDNDIYFQSSCGCGGWHPPAPREWQDAADSINMQTRTSERFGDIMGREALKWGITLPPVEAA